MLATFVAVCALPAGAAPSVPAGADVVLTTVPRAELAQRETIATLRAALTAAPDRADLAARLARAYLDLHTEVGDPRYLGYAGAAIDAVPATPAIRLVEADLLQARHDFAAARETLDSLVREEPRIARAWLMLAAVSLVQGDYAVTRNACARLALLGHDFEALACGAEVASLSGRSREAYDKLAATLSLDPDLAPPVAAWGHQIASGIARRLGDNAAARQHLRTSLELRPAMYPVIALADLLLESHKYDDAWRLLADRPATDAVVLRRALTARRLARADAEDLAEQATRRIRALQRRGEQRHAREEAWHALNIADRPEVALAAARRNWQMQRETDDAQLLLRAALDARQPQAAAPVLEWMQANASDDVHLQRLARQLGGDS